MPREDVDDVSAGHAVDRVAARVTRRPEFEASPETPSAARSRAGSARRLGAHARGRLGSTWRRCLRATHDDLSRVRTRPRSHPSPTHPSRSSRTPARTSCRRASRIRSGPRANRSRGALPPSPNRSTPQTSPSRSRSRASPSPRRRLRRFSRRRPHQALLGGELSSVARRRRGWSRSARGPTPRTRARRGPPAGRGPRATLGGRRGRRSPRG